MRSDLVRLGLGLGLAATAVACSDGSYQPQLVDSKPVVVTDGGSGGDAAVPDAAPTVDASGLTGQCSPNSTWVKPRTVGVSGKGTFGAISADETTVAWIDGTTIHWADRKTPSSLWDEERTLSVPNLASVHLALSGSGLRIIVVVANGRTLGELARGAKGDDFEGAPDSTAFQALTFALAEAPPDARVDDPVLALDDNHLVFTFARSGASSSMRSVARAEAGARWSLGQAIGASALAPVGSKLRRPTGVSADRLTLFYWDEVDGAEHAAFRATESDEFSTVVTLGDKPGAQVDPKCERIYYGSPTEFTFAVRQ